MNMKILNTIKHIVRHKLLPDSLFLLKKSVCDKNIYLTFDDGPVSKITTQLLDLLEKHQIKVTFFIVGTCAKKNPDILINISERGHTIANHSYNHPRFDLLTLKDQIVEILHTNDIIKKVTNKECRLFRSPQGRWNVKLLWYMFKHKITAVHWSRDSMDFKKGTIESIINDFKTNPIDSGEIILFHDDNTLCINALDQLIPWWKDQGYTFKALSNN